MDKDACPNCSTKLDDFTAMEKGATPSEGDISVCLYCSTVLQFTESLNLRIADIEVIEVVTLQLSKAQRIAKDFQLRQNKGGKYEHQSRASQSKRKTRDKDKRR